MKYKLIKSNQFIVPFHTVKRSENSFKTKNGPCIYQNCKNCTRV